VRSWVSDENWEAEDWERRERVLAEGERIFGFGCEDDSVADGLRVFAEPRTRPPPSVLRDMLILDYGSMGKGSPRNAEGGGWIRSQYGATRDEVEGRA
jgi:hypothetical protein